ncbi:hypothetical protein SPRG_04046 [Saprolegnia parasitica CBS 223.65]|uniref:Uncharacterized protein n=1 Tax=Saprolegnia parasitica (strain CBS 223.65) TaxID=695850 RepID=A0A067CY20_SAPPC|nr:hypothetical protein SPRG_04046 [Saprolegnia parasitica CBS 223.65]KDO31431.1 hypothetical protein SPRG_04046 [Saprolegnia parasitica CBS 223.65]|eukprot:XP_012198026.1 hypothetical protein SPRG_04046 [Saprolegnia parasitica CBS 223.65]
MSHVTIPSLKRTLSGGNVPPSMPSSHMSMNAAASLSQLATGDRSPRHGHRHEPPPSHGHAPMPHAYSGPHAGYSNHGHAPSVVGPPPMTRAVTASAAYNRQPPISSRMSTAPVNPQLSAAAPSRSQLPSSSGPPPQDWRMYLTIEERQAVRSKIQDAYTSTCKTYEELLQAASAIEEELLHIAAPSRLDYFKSGFEFENRVKLKREQLQGQLAALEKKNYASAPSSAPKGEGRTTNNNNKASPETAAKKPRKQ